MAAAQVEDGRRFRAWRFATTWIVLVAFALQAYLTQTHFHPTQLAAEAAAAVQTAAHADVEKAPPGGDHALACPLCQAVASAGAFVAPAAIAALPVAGWAFRISPPPARAGRIAGPAGFAWRSRAPPQA